MSKTLIGCLNDSSRPFEPCDWLFVYGAIFSLGKGKGGGERGGGRRMGGGGRLMDDGEAQSH